jgi:spermidine synthase
MTRLIKRASAEARAFKQRKASAYNGSEKLQPPRVKRRPDIDEHDDVPVLEAPRKPRFAPVTFSEEGGVRFLHFGTEWVQGAMRISKPLHIELEYAQQMMAWLLFLETPERIVQLGLGTGALTKFSHRFLPHAKVEAVELNPAVIVAARTMFAL